MTKIEYDNYRKYRKEIVRKKLFNDMLIIIGFCCIFAIVLYKYGDRGRYNFKTAPFVPIVFVK